MPDAIDSVLKNKPKTKEEGMKVGALHKHFLSDRLEKEAEARGYEKGKKDVIENGLIRGAEYQKILQETIEKTKKETAKADYDFLESLKLDDLYLQATRERSHFYVASIVKKLLDKKGEIKNRWCKE